MMKEILDWSKLEPRVYQKSSTQTEVENLIAETQPIMQRIQRTQQEVAAKIQSQKAKGGS